MTEAACEASKRADAELEKAYLALRALHEKDRASLARLEKVQGAWKAFRDAYLDFLYPSDAPPGYFGSVEPMCFCGAAEALSSGQLREFKRLLERPQHDGDVCSGYVP
jgi:uncharacterized protein YecT (DUF1311 family)